MSLLRVEGLAKRFGGLVAVDGVEFEIAEGDINAVIGPNGAGKTTLFNLISGFLQPTKGRVVFAGRDLTGIPPHRVAAHGLLRTFQLARLFGDMTAEENVRVGFHGSTRGGVWAALARPRWARIQEAHAVVEAEELLELVGLRALAHVRAGQLPYGQQRLLEIARAMAARPKLLLLDEPAAGLNVQETERLTETILRIKRMGVTILLIEHDMRFVMGIAQFIVVLDFGRQIAQGAPQHVSQHPDVLAAYLGGLEDIASV